MTTLTNPSDGELDSAVAEHVAGWKPEKFMVNPPRPTGYGMAPGGAIGPIPAYSRSMDAVWPLMAAFSHKNGLEHGGEPIVFRIYSPACNDYVWTVQPVWMHHDGGLEETPVSDKSLPRACCLALLAAHGVAVKVVS
jgi:hypothetical protein